MLGLLLRLPIRRELELLLIMNLKNRIGATNKKGLGGTIRTTIRITIRTTIRITIVGTIRGSTISAAPQNNIFREYIFIEVKLLPLTAPYSKPIPIPPSRPNDLKHIAIDY